MKKILLVVILLLLVIFNAWFMMISEDRLDSDSIGTIDLVDENATSFPFEREDFALWMTLIESLDWLEPYDGQVKGNYFQVSLKTVDGQSLDLELWVDFKDENVYIKKEEAYFLSDFRLPVLASLLSHAVFHPYYPDASPPELLLDLGDFEVKPYRLKEVWQYALADGSYTKSPPRQKEEVHFEILTIFEDQLINLKVNAEQVKLQVEAFLSSKNQWQAIEVNEDGGFYPLAVGETLDYRIRLIVDKKYDKSPLGEITYEIPIKVLLRPLLEVSGEEFYQGELIKLKIEPLDEEAQVMINQNMVDQLVEYRVGKTLYAMIPLVYWAETGTHEIHAQVISKGVSLLDEKIPIKVLESTYAVQNLTVNAEVESSTRTDEAYAQYHAEFMPVRQVSNPKQLWEGAFIWPIEGRLTTDFGTRRRVNGAMTSYRHNGIDLAAPTGTPIKASNSGIVVFSSYLTLTGNTVMIDHGLGLFTYYLHMDSRKVQVGDYVSKSEVIGTVGTTGFSTGPHLHFTVSYHLTNVNPHKILKWDGLWPQ